MSQFNTWNHLEFNNNEAGLFLSYENKNGAKIAAGLRRIFLLEVDLLKASN